MRITTICPRHAAQFNLNLPKWKPQVVGLILQKSWHTKRSVAKTKEKDKNKIAVNYLRLNKNIGPEKLLLVKTLRPSQHMFLIRLVKQQEITIIEPRSGDITATVEKCIN